MSRIAISFRVYDNASKTQKSLKFCARLEGTGRYCPRSLEFFNMGSLIEPDFSKFNKKKQRFTSKSSNATSNNALLGRIESFVDAVLTDYAPESIEELWKLVEKRTSSPKPKVVSEEQTLGGFIKQIIGEQKNCENNRLPSGNFRIYIPVLHYLQQEDSKRNSQHIIRIPLSQVSDKDFECFGEYIKSLRKPSYVSLMKYFKRLHNIAVRRGLASEPLKFRYLEHTPPKSIDELTRANKGIASLSSQQIAQIESLDLSQIYLSGVHPDFYKQLYLDTVLLMYYLYSRPMDILSLKTKHIKKCDKGFYVEYLPMKKKNSPNAIKEFVKCPINEKAMAIIRKYEGQSPCGYILPFSENKRDWDLSIPEQYHTRYNRCNAMLGKINSFLKKVGDKLGIYFENDTFSTYVFRHSAISIAITEKHIPPMVVAKIAGTSLKEIERSYMDHTQQMFDYFQ